jgi:hypothetical protein
LAGYEILVSVSYVLEYLEEGTLLYAAIRKSDVNLGESGSFCVEGSREKAGVHRIFLVH